MKKILYAFSIGFFGACGYAIVNMLVAPKADPVIGLSFFAVIFIVGFIIGLFDYDRKMKKKVEEEKRQAEKEQTDRLMHTWESHLFLKLLERISNLLAGKGYKWQSQLYKSKQKSNFISHHIINPIKDLNHNFHKILTETYNNHLRNSFSHSDYYINIDKETIYFYDQGVKYNITFKE